MASHSAMKQRTQCERLCPLVARRHSGAFGQLSIQVKASEACLTPAQHMRTRSRAIPGLKIAEPPVMAAVLTIHLSAQPAHLLSQPDTYGPWKALAVNEEGLQILDVSPIAPEVQCNVL